MEKLVTINKVISLLTEHDCITSLMTSEDEKAKGFLLALQSGVDTYDLRNSSDTGVKQQLLLSHMVNVGAVNDAFRVAVVAEANPAPQPEPEPNPSYELSLGDNRLEHVVTFKILESLPKGGSVELCQRYGEQGDLTEWHCVKTVAVRYKQDTYKVCVPACEHSVRELKLVSPVQLQADWDALDAPEPVEQTVLCNGEDYVIRTSNQGLELDIVINDGSVDNVFDVRLEVCEVDQGQHDVNNWFEITNAFTPIRQGKGSRFKWVIEASSKRIKTYNKLYLMPRKAVDFTATVKAV